MARGPHAWLLLCAAACLLAQEARAEPHPTTPRVSVLCERDGRIVLESREDCWLHHGRARSSVAASDGRGDSSWARWDGEGGTTLRRVLGCKSRTDLRQVSASRSAQSLAIRGGHCTQLSASTAFQVQERRPDAVRISTASDGALWVSGDPDAESLEPAASPEKLVPEDGEPDAAADAQVSGTAFSVEGSCPAESPDAKRSATAFEAVQIADWQRMPGAGDDHRLRERAGARGERCARVRVCYRGRGSRLVDHADFEASFSGGESRQGDHFLGGGVRLGDGQSATGVVCFSGSFLTDIVSLRLR